MRPIVSPQYARKEKHRQTARNHADRPRRNEEHIKTRKNKLEYLRRIEEYERQREIDAVSKAR